MTGEALIAIGSNIDPERNIVKALDLLDVQCPIEATSTFYWTKAVARDGQPAFLNGACRCTTVLAPRDLKFGVLRRIEAELGRVRETDPHAPREIDLDIGLMGDWVVNEPGLTVPDPDIQSRGFVAIPLCELAPNAVVPTVGKTLSAIASSFDASDMEEDSSFSERIRLRYSE